jgi:DNA-binding LacI/PurR family transcriptional regulator
VFFSPLELTKEKESVNIRIVELFDKAEIPIVLMDRDVMSFPSRSKYDLIGVDNLRVGYLMTQHLIDHGCTELRFVARPHSAPTVKLRAMGFGKALREAGLKPECDNSNVANVSIGNVEDLEFLRGLVHGEEPIGIVCANDTTAARLMHHLSEMGHDIPGHVRVVGIDDVKYAKFLRVPLTTYRQPLKDIAAVAIDMMLSKVSDPKLPPRTVYLDGELVLRRSCGCT